MSHHQNNNIEIKLDEAFNERYSMYTLLHDLSLGINQLDSFLIANRAEHFTPLLGNELAEYFSFSRVKSAFDNLLRDQTHIQNPLVFWTFIHVALKDFPIYEEYKSILEAIITETSFTEMIDTQGINGLSYLKIAANQANHFSEESKAYFFKKILELAKYVRENEQAIAGNFDMRRSELLNLFGHLLFEIIVIMNKSKTLAESISKISPAIDELLNTWSNLSDPMRQVLQRLYETLPSEQSMQLAKSLTISRSM